MGEDPRTFKDSLAITQDLRLFTLLHRTFIDTTTGDLNGLLVLGCDLEDLQDGGLASNLRLIQHREQLDDVLLD